jgi:hypothetical protein
MGHASIPFVPAAQSRIDPALIESLTGDAQDVALMVIGISIPLHDDSDPIERNSELTFIELKFDPINLQKGSLPTVTATQLVARLHEWSSHRRRVEHSSRYQ